MWPRMVLLLFTAMANWPCVALFDLAWHCVTSCGIVWPFVAFLWSHMAFYGLLWQNIVFFLAVIDPNSFGLIRKQF